MRNFLNIVFDKMKQAKSFRNYRLKKVVDGNSVEEKKEKKIGIGNSKDY